MNKIRRGERVAAIARILSREPGRLFTLREFVDLFECAKSTLSEDIASVRAVFAQYGLGYVESINGAAGGIRFFPFHKSEDDLAFVQKLCTELSDKDRLLDGDYLYTLDILANTAYLTRIGELFAKLFARTEPEVVVTAESMGVPVAMAVANALGIPFVAAKRQSRIWYGPAVTIDYSSASSERIQTMCLPRRIMGNGQRALLIDDFMRGGGTVRALASIMEEFHATVCGVGAIIARANPPVKAVPEYYALIELGRVNKAEGIIEVRPAGWLSQ